MADVGLISQYVADCDALAQIAAALNKPAEEKELRERANFYRASLASLWDEKTGMFLNKDLHTREFSPRTSPTNFYPLLARAATPVQAQRMIRDHLLNPEEFGGKWVIPATPRNDPAFQDQNYWRGRIWGPMNFLVYLGLRNYDQPEARKNSPKNPWNYFKRNGPPTITSTKTIIPSPAPATTSPPATVFITGALCSPSSIIWRPPINHRQPTTSTKAPPQVRISNWARHSL